MGFDASSGSLPFPLFQMSCLQINVLLLLLLLKRHMRWARGFSRNDGMAAIFESVMSYRKSDGQSIRIRSRNSHAKFHPDWVRYISFCGEGEKVWGGNVLSHVLFNWG